MFCFKIKEFYEINDFFEREKIPWIIFDSQLLKLDNKLFELNLKSKALTSLKENIISEELQESIKNYNENNYGNCFLNCKKALESAMKFFLGEFSDEKEINNLIEKFIEKVNTVIDNNNFDKNKDILKNISNIIKNISNLIKKILDLISKVRNHFVHETGPGQDKKISKELTNFLINLTLSLIIFIVEKKKWQH